MGLQNINLLTLFDTSYKTTDYHYYVTGSINPQMLRVGTVNVRSVA